LDLHANTVIKRSNNAAVTLITVSHRCPGVILLLSLYVTGVSGPIEFDANGDLKPSSKAYAYLRFTPQGVPQLQGLIEQPTAVSSSSSGSSSSSPRRSLRDVQQ
jgi:hypothetical protein